jgi:hypothetical protein
MLCHKLLTFLPACQMLHMLLAYQMLRMLLPVYRMLHMLLAYQMCHMLLQ